MGLQNNVLRGFGPLSCGPGGPCGLQVGVLEGLWACKLGPSKGWWPTKGEKCEKLKMEVRKSKVQFIDLYPLFSSKYVICTLVFHMGEQCNIEGLRLSATHSNLTKPTGHRRAGTVSLVTRMIRSGLSVSLSLCLSVSLLIRSSSP